MEPGISLHDHADGHADARSHAVPIYGDPIGCADVRAASSNRHNTTFDVIMQ
jgi:hypothetical protein